MLIDAVAFGVPPGENSGYRSFAVTAGVWTEELSEIEARSTVGEPLVRDRDFRYAVASYRLTSGRWAVSHYRAVADAGRALNVEVRTYLMHSDAALALRHNPFALSRCLHLAGVDETFGTASIRALSLGGVDLADDWRALESLHFWNPSTLAVVLTRLWKGMPVAVVVPRPLPRPIEALILMLPLEDRRRISQTSYYASRRKLPFQVYQTSSASVLADFVPSDCIVDPTMPATGGDVHPVAEWLASLVHGAEFQTIAAWVDSLSGRGLAVRDASLSALKSLALLSSADGPKWRRNLRGKVLELGVRAEDQAASTREARVLEAWCAARSDGVREDDLVTAFVEDLLGDRPEARQLAERVTHVVEMIVVGSPLSTGLHFALKLSWSGELLRAILSALPVKLEVEQAEADLVLRRLFLLNPLIPQQLRPAFSRVLLGAWSSWVSIPSGDREKVEELFVTEASTAPLAHLDALLGCLDRWGEEGLAWALFSGPVLDARVRAGAEDLFESPHVERVMRHPTGLEQVLANPVVAGHWASARGLLQAVLAAPRSSEVVREILERWPEGIVGLHGERTSGETLLTLLGLIPEDARTWTGRTTELIVHAKVSWDPDQPLADSALCALWARVAALDPSQASRLRLDLAEVLVRNLVSGRSDLKDQPGLPAVLGEELSGVLARRVLESPAPHLDVGVAARLSVGSSQKTCPLRVGLLIEVLRRASVGDGLGVTPELARELAVEVADSQTSSGRVGFPAVVRALSLDDARGEASLVALASLVPGELREVVIGCIEKWPAEDRMQAVRVLARIPWPTTSEGSERAGAALRVRLERPPSDLTTLTKFARNEFRSDTPSRAQVIACASRVFQEALREIESLPRLDREPSWFAVLRAASLVLPNPDECRRRVQQAYAPPSAVLEFSVLVASGSLRTRVRASLQARRRSPGSRTKARVDALLGQSTDRGLAEALGDFDGYRTSVGTVCLDWQLWETESVPSSDGCVLVLDCRDPTWLNALEALGERLKLAGYRGPIGVLQLGADKNARRAFRGWAGGARGSSFLRRLASGTQTSLGLKIVASAAGPEAFEELVEELAKASMETATEEES